MSPLDGREIERRVGDGPWRYADGALIREFECSDFAAAIRLLNAVAAAAERAEHHPDLLLHGWNKLRVTVSTHSEGGVTDADFALAGAIDAIAP